MKPPILNMDDVTFRDWGHGDRYQARLGSLSRPLGARMLGYNITVVPPGKCAFPHHSHRVNEEMFMILEGEGELRLGQARHPLRRGDVVACATGGPETAHQIRNTSETADLKYLAVSTRQSPEIAEYPDTGKFGIFHELPPDAEGRPRGFRFITRGQASMDDYWEGE